MVKLSLAHNNDKKFKHTTPCSKKFNIYFGESHSNDITTQLELVCTLMDELRLDIILSNVSACCCEAWN